eukprot:TRINITY_DN27536_c0_g1_i1.p2 TRINITY_DN27536_c0_g1~~TRINITY_DN27536_c0_g1_i1.p2  ORF type:complete len:291 (-),score=69.09 TRINITY_DN27536_c0_g1_i1:370-1242(-)
MPSLVGSEMCIRDRYVCVYLLKIKRRKSKNTFLCLAMNNEKQKLKNQFTNAANSLTALFRSTIAIQDEAYRKGQKDAVNEIMEFIIKKSGGDIRNLSSAALIEFLQCKLYEANQVQPRSESLFDSSAASKPNNGIDDSYKGSGSLMGLESTNNNVHGNNYVSEGVGGMNGMYQGGPFSSMQSAGLLGDSSRYFDFQSAGQSDYGLYGSNSGSGSGMNAGQTANGGNALGSNSGGSGNAGNGSLFFGAFSNNGSVNNTNGSSVANNNSNGGGFFSAERPKFHLGKKMQKRL